MAYVDFIMKIHKSTKRDYVGRVVECDKAECAEVSLKFDKNYFDGDRKYGYGGYRYDGRWRTMAEDMVKHYKLPPDAKILDIGCAKGFLLYEFKQILPNCTIAGIDVSEYAIENAMPEVKKYLQVGNATKLPFADKSFDLVVSVNTIHNLYNYDLHEALKEIERVGRGGKHLIFDSYRNEREKMNLMYWQLTCRAILTPQEWEWTFKQAGYTGDYSYIVFE